MRTTSSGYSRIDTGRGHWYKDPAGDKLPAVTKVIKDGLAHENFVGAAAKKVAAWAGDYKDTFVDLTPSEVTKLATDYYFEHRFDRAERGQTIHDHAARLLAGEEVDIEPGDEAIVDTFLRFAADWELDPIAVEAVILSKKWGYAGTADFIGRATRRRLMALLDWKTGATGVWPDTALQLAAYRYADVYAGDDNAEARMPDFELVAAVWLQDDRYDVIPVAAGPDIHRVFVHAMRTARFVAKKRHDTVGSPITPDDAVAHRFDEEVAG